MTELEALHQRVKQAVEEAVLGSMVAPPAEDTAFLAECVVIMGWHDINGRYVTTHLRCGSPWATEGLVIDALREIEDPGIEILLDDECE